MICCTICVRDIIIRINRDIIDGTIQNSQSLNKYSYVQGKTDGDNDVIKVAEQLMKYYDTLNQIDISVNGSYDIQKELIVAVNGDKDFKKLLKKVMKAKIKQESRDSNNGSKKN